VRRAQRVGASAALALVCSSAFAFGYCRTTTCDPRKESCGPPRGCPTRGIPLFWPSQCVTFSVQEDGSRKRDIPYVNARDTIVEGFLSWRDASCPGGGTPSIDIRIANGDDGVSCARQEYNQDAGNANIWMFLDRRWPYAGSDETLALTTITFNVENGEIYDADVEINSFDKNLTIGNDNIGSDLLSVVTHEAGHFFGLAHSEMSEATMFPSYNPGETKLRTLTADDVSGICDIYPPERVARTDSCVPRHGFSRECGSAQDEDGCSTSPRPARTSGVAGLSALSALAASAIALRLRSRRRRPRRA